MQCSINRIADRRSNIVNRFGRVVAGSFAICLLRSAILLACPFCSDNVASGMAKGFFWSILLMLAVPVVVVGTIAGVIWRAGRHRPPDDN
jgi:ABC-type uncharacterized transport system permease subunit